MSGYSESEDLDASDLMEESNGSYPMPMFQQTLPPQYHGMLHGNPAVHGPQSHLGTNIPQFQPVHVQPNEYGGVYGAGLDQQQFWKDGGSISTCYSPGLKNNKGRICLGWFCYENEKLFI